MTRFGQCCLLARRLVERGVRFVTINTFITVFDEITWDIHGTKPFTSIEGMKDIVAPDVRPGLQRAHRGPAPARHAGQHAGLQPRRVRPHAEGESRRRPRPLAAVLDRLFRRRRRARAAASSARATRSAPIPPNAPSRPRTSSPRSTSLSASIWKPNCRDRRDGRIPWWIAGSIRSRGCFEKRRNSEKTIP